MIKVITGFVIVFGAILIIRWTLNALRAADVKEKLDEIEADAKLSAKISAVDKEDAEEVKKELDDFKNL